MIEHNICENQTNETQSRENRNETITRVYAASNELSSTQNPFCRPLCCGRHNGYVRPNGLLHSGVVPPDAPGKRHGDVLCRLRNRLRLGDDTQLPLLELVHVRHKPDLKNAGGFLFARAVNLGIQLGLLPVILMWLPTWRDDFISYVVIFIGGCINYFICLLFFNTKNQTPTETK